MSFSVRLSVNNRAVVDRRNENNVMLNKQVGLETAQFTKLKLLKIEVFTRKVLFNEEKITFHERKLYSRTVHLITLKHI